MRAGGFALSLLSVPVNYQVVQALESEPMSLMELRRAVGNPPQTTLRGNLRILEELGVVERRSQNASPGNVSLQLGKGGHDLTLVAEVLQEWLDRSPNGPVELGTSASKSVLRALVQGWSDAIVRVLATRPIALTELSRLIPGISYPSLERRLIGMHLTGLIERCSSPSRGTPYTVSEWMREAVAPLLSAARWERFHALAEAPMQRLDFESVFFLTMPKVALPDEQLGSLRLAVELRGEGKQRFAGVIVEVADGRVTSCVCRVEGHANAWASGNTRAWLAALLDENFEELEIGGDSQLARDLLEKLHSVSFSGAQRV